MDADYGYLNAAITKMLEKVTSAGGAIDGAMQPIYFTVGVLLLVIACSKFMWERSLVPLAAFVVRYVQLMALIMVSGNWMPLTDKYVAQMGSFGAGVAGFDILQLAPGTVIVHALKIAGRMYEENMSWMRLIFGSADDTIAHMLLGIGCIGTILMSIFMAAWIMLFYVVFKLASLAALVFLAFMMFDATRFMAAPGLARILAYGVQMLVLGLSTGLFFMTLDALDLSGHLHVSQSVALLVVMLFFGLLFKYTTDIAREQISGMPSLGLHDLGRMGAGAASTALGMLGSAALPALGTFAGMKLAGPSAPAAGLPAPSLGGVTGGAMAGRGGVSAGQAGAASLGAPRAAARLLENPNYTTWTEARDLPRSAQRMLQGQRSLPPPPRSLPPPSRD